MGRLEIKSVLSMSRCLFNLFGLLGLKLVYTKCYHASKKLDCLNQSGMRADLGIVSDGSPERHQSL